MTRGCGSQHRGHSKEWGCRPWHWGHRERSGKSTEAPATLRSVPQQNPHGSDAVLTPLRHWGFPHLFCAAQVHPESTNTRGRLWFGSSVQRSARCPPGTPTRRLRCQHEDHVLRIIPQRSVADSRAATLTRGVASAILQESTPTAFIKNNTSKLKNSGQKYVEFSCQFFSSLYNPKHSLNSPYD